jgi:hypothetical protein
MSNKIFQTASVNKVAQNFYPAHGFDQNYVPYTPSPRSYNISDKQKSLIDIVMGNEKDSYASPLLNLMFNSPSLNSKIVTSSDKELLLSAWRQSSQQEGSMVVADSVSDRELNALKAKGLIAGIGHTISFTPTGRKALVETILESKSTLYQTANSMKKFVKMCETLSYPEVQEGVEKSKIVRDEKGNWVVKKTKDDKNVGNPQQDVAQMNDGQLQAAYKATLKAESDHFKYKTASSTSWESKYDINKAMALKETLFNEIQRRKNAR